MISQGVWFLMIITFTQAGTIELVPYMTFPSYQMCNAWKDIEADEYMGGAAIFTCTQEADA